MVSVNEKLLDRYIRHAVYIERFKAGEAKKISRHLSREVFPELIDKLMTKIKATDPSKLKKLWAIRRLRRLTASMDKIIKVGMIKAKDATVDSLMDLAEWEAKWNKGMIEKMVPLDIDMSMPNPEVLRQAVLTTPFEGHKLGTWFNAYSKSVRIGMMGAVKKGISAGEDIPSIGRRLRKVTSLKRMQAEYIARTAVSSVVNGAKEAVFLQNKKLVKEIQYVSTLDTRTTLICINLDGQIFVVGRGPRPPMHFNCRSTTIPVISSWKEFGIKAPPPATRASMTGKVPAKMNYKTWLRKQSKATQIKVLGKRRAELYRSGRVKIDRFVGKDYKPLTLKQLAKREGIEFAPPRTDPLVQLRIQDNPVLVAKWKKLNAMSKTNRLAQIQLKKVQGKLALKGIRPADITGMPVVPEKLRVTIPEEVKGITSKDVSALKTKLEQHKTNLRKKLGFDVDPTLSAGQRRDLWNAHLRNIDPKEFDRLMLTEKGSAFRDAANKFSASGQGKEGIEKLLTDYRNRMDRLVNPKVSKEMLRTNYKVKGQNCNYRSNYKFTTGEVNVAFDPTYVLKNKENIWHELGHALENDFDVRDKANIWLKLRAYGKDPIAMKRLVKWASENDIAFRDKFIDPYVGRVYNRGTTEAISMGIEKFHTAENMKWLAERDFDHFSFIHALLTGVL